MELSTDYDGNIIIIHAEKVFMKGMLGDKVIVDIKQDELEVFYKGKWHIIKG